MQFFRNMGRSVWDSSFYQEKLMDGVKGSWKYFFLLLLILALVRTVNIALPLIAVFGDEGTREIVATMANVYPEELVVVVQDGVASTNVEEPYLIPFPEDWIDEYDKQAGIENIIVIDTQQEFTIKQFDQYNAVAVLSSEILAFRDPNDGQIQPLYLSEIGEDFVVNRELVEQGAAMIIPFLKIAVGAIVVFLPILLYIGYIIGLMAYLLIGALLIWIAAAIRKVPMTYGLAYKLGMYMLTLPLMYKVVAWFVPALDITFIFTLIFFLVAIVHLSKPQDAKAEVSQIGEESPDETTKPAPFAEGEKV